MSDDGEDNITSPEQRASGRAWLSLQGRLGVVPLAAITRRGAVPVWLRASWSCPGVAAKAAGQPANCRRHEGWSRSPSPCTRRGTRSLICARFQPDWGKPNVRLIGGRVETGASRLAVRHAAPPAYPTLDPAEKPVPPRMTSRQASRSGHRERSGESGRYSRRARARRPGPGAGSSPHRPARIAQRLPPSSTEPQSTASPSHSHNATRSGREAKRPLSWLDTRRPDDSNGDMALALDRLAA